MYFSRVSVRPDAKQAVASFLAARAATSHNLVWTLFGDRTDRERDFLYREADDFTYMVLSAREPVDSKGWFEVQRKLFAPQFRTGQRLSAMLRTNATVSAFQRGTRGKREDLLGRAIREARQRMGALTPERRAEVIEQAGYGWFARKGTESGFSVERDDFAVANNGFVRLPHKGHQQTFGVMDIEARITVTDPVLLSTSLGRGFGASKGFGCGLLMVRPLH